MARTVDQRQRQQRRQAVTEVAAALFARQGYAETTTAEIAQVAGISTGNLFYYFPDKPAIFRAIFEQDIPASRKLFESHAATDDPVAAILDVVSTLAAPARDQIAPGLLVELLRRVGRDPQLAEVLATNDAIVRDGLANLVRQAGAAGRVDRTLDADQAATWIHTIIDAAFLNADVDSPNDPVPMLRLIITRFLAATTTASAEHGPTAEQDMT